MMSTLRADSNTDLLVDLTDVRSTMGDLVGGKAANLGELISAGMPVPAGFCITTNAYDGACQRLRAEHRWDELIELLGAEPPESTRDTAAEIRSLLANVAIPDELSAALTSAYAELGPSGAVAVRSSATAEDLPYASFAGQQDTYLNVVGDQALLDAVRHCWSSLWTDRAVSYRSNNGIDHRTVRLAVVVQRMVDAECSGVLFTANPVTGRRREAVIDANSGLGESVVSGAVDPDHFVVDTASGTITCRELGTKSLSIHAKPGGGTESLGHTGSSAFAVPDEQVRALAALGDQVEQHYGAPQDIEWALDVDGRCWLTQSRPITTLFPLPAESEPGLRVYFSINVAQGLHRPLTPMGASMLRHGIGGAMYRIGLPTGGPARTPAVWRQAAGWLFFDVTGVVRHPWGRRIAPHLFAMMEARSGRVFAHLLDHPAFSLLRTSRWPLLRRFGRVFAVTKLPVRAFRALRRPDRARTEAFRIADEIRRELASRTGTDPQSRFASARNSVFDSVMPRMIRLVPTLWTALVLSRLVPRIIGKSVSAEEIQIALRGIPHNVTTNMDLELWQLAVQAHGDRTTTRLFTELSPVELAEHYHLRTLPPEIQSGLERFLAQYGHRAICEIDIGMPRWSEDPTHVLGMITNYLRTAETGHSAQEQYEQGVREAEAAVRRIITRLRRENRLRARVAELALGRARQLVGLREMPKFCMVLGFAHARAQLLAVGQDLASAGRLDTVDDVFFLDLAETAEAVAGADHRRLVIERREIHERELRRRHVPRLLLSDGTEPEATMPSVQRPGELTGASASAGTATGKARVILDPTGARLEPGEILVAPSTDPGWTPLFLTAAALVMEMGGPNSHGATVAREYGIPAVVGVPGAIDTIRDGQMITVNGSAGSVHVE